MSLTDENINSNYIENNNRKPYYNYEKHLDEILKEIFSYYKEAGLIKFEEISTYLKAKIKNINCEYKIKKEKNNDIIDMTLYEQQIFKHINNKKSKTLLKIETKIEDILEKSLILEQSGITFGKDTWFKIKLAMKKIVLKENVEFLRFFGKIYGRESDYFVIYGRHKSYTNTKYPKNFDYEPSGLEGINKYTFWVSNSLLEEWSILPEISANHLKESFLIKYYFTGNLKHKVKSFSFFSGSESHLLKCQILRIMHSCFISPEGFLKIKQIENSEEIYGVDLNDRVAMYDEEYKPNLSVEEMISLDKWVHEYPYIYPNGKIIDLDSQEPIPILRPIGQDNPFPGTEKPIWAIKEIGDKMTYNTIGGNGTVSYSTIVIKNLIWNGSICAYKNGEFINLYIGDGSRLKGTLYYPLNVNEIEKEAEEQIEHSEPNPDKEPVIEEPKKDDEDNEEKEENEENDNENEDDMNDDN